MTRLQRGEQRRHEPLQHAVAGPDHQLRHRFMAGPDAPYAVTQVGEHPGQPTTGLRRGAARPAPRLEKRDPERPLQLAQLPAQQGLVDALLAARGLGTATLMLGACNTMRGVGKDTEAVGDKIQDEAEQHMDDEKKDDGRQGESL